jgi:zinc transporter, ZIP family
VTFGSTVALGALAGSTIYLGLPVARMRLLSGRARVALAMFAVGILAFVLVDVLAGALGLVEHALTSYHDHHGSFGAVAARAALLGVGFTAGCAGIGVVERRLRRNPAVLPPVAGGATAEAFVASEQDRHAEKVAAARRSALQTGLIIAIAIGLHNFAEGLAIGVSARAGEISLATVLIIGFALHNATEGFGIVGPLGAVVPSWRWLALAGLIGGGPTFLGSLLGYQVTSEPLELCFYAVAGGAIIYVIGEIWHGMRRHGHRELGLLFLSTGFMLGVLTDLVVAYGGG